MELVLNESEFTEKMNIKWVKCLNGSKQDYEHYIFKGRRNVCLNLTEISLTYIAFLMEIGKI